MCTCAKPEPEFTYVERDDGRTFAGFRSALFPPCRLSRVPYRGCCGTKTDSLKDWQGRSSLTATANQRIGKKVARGATVGLFGGVSSFHPTTPFSLCSTRKTPGSPFRPTSAILRSTSPTFGHVRTLPLSLVLRFASRDVTEGTPAPGCSVIDRGGGACERLITRQPETPVTATTTRSLFNSVETRIFFGTSKSNL